MKYNIVNEIKLIYTRKGNTEKKVLNSQDATDIFREHFDADQIDYRESFYSMYMNQANKVLGIQKYQNLELPLLLLTSELSCRGLIM